MLFQEKKSQTLGYLSLTRHDAIDKYPVHLLILLAKRGLDVISFTRDFIRETQLHF